MTITYPFNLNPIDSSWNECLQRGLNQIDPRYLEELIQSKNWLPGPEKIFNAFSIPLNKVNYILFGESPYPRQESANGYAFWDAQVKELWSETGLSKKVNRATSLRNIMKMLLIAEGCLDKNSTGQDNIAKINKEAFVQSGPELFSNLLEKGFLLLNASLVLHSKSPNSDARFWHPFIKELLICLLEHRPKVKFILFGRIAQKIDQLITSHPGVLKLYAEHPYNHSFITNPELLLFFKPLHLLRK